MLTNRPTRFMKSKNFETGLSDCHKLVCSILRAFYKKFPPKIIKYRDQKHFDQIKIIRDLDSKLLKGDLYRNCDEPYEKLSEIFIDILNHHTPLKEKRIRGNYTPFMTEKLSKAITEKSKTRNKYLKWPSRENYVSYKKSKNKCNSFFIHDLDSNLLKGDLYRNCDEPYEKLPDIFIDILNHHTPLKEKRIRGNYAPFMTKELSKATTEKSKTRNKYNK